MVKITIQDWFWADFSEISSQNKIGFAALNPSRLHHFPQSYFSMSIEQAPNLKIPDKP